MKRKLLVIIASVMLFTMSGCVEVVDLDDEQEAKFIGYSAYAVLEHDNNYMLGLNMVEIDEDEIVEPTTDSQPYEPGSEEETSSSGNISGGEDYTGDITETVSMSEAVGVEGVSITYKDIEICDSYPEADGTPVFSFKALAGKKLVVLKFDMKNTTEEDINVDILSKDLSFKGIFNKAIKTNACTTLLLEAMNTYNSTIKAGETAESILVYEMSDGYVTNLTDIQIEVRSENEANLVKIK